MKRLIAIMLLVTVIIFVGCTTNAQNKGNCDDGITCNAVNLADNVGPVAVSQNLEKIEIYHFHATNQCYSCITMGDLAEKTVNAYYPDLLNSGKMTFGHINADLAENKELVIKYGATGSSLWIGTYLNDEFHKEENVKVWYKINNENDYLSYLKGVLDKRISGDLS